MEKTRKEYESVAKKMSRENLERAYVTINLNEDALMKQKQTGYAEDFLMILEIMYQYTMTIGAVSSNANSPR